MKRIEVRVPGDKSISHRSLIFAALAEGQSHIKSILQSDDVKSTAGALRVLGVDMPPLSSSIEFSGRGLRGFRAPKAPLDCGNSGTTARLLIGVAAALPFRSTFIGDASLSKRPMKRVASLLEQMGATFEFPSGDGLPLSVLGGSLKDFDYVNERASAQIKSALLLAGLISGAKVRVAEPRRSRDHTENMLTALGARISRDHDSVTVERTERIAPLDIVVPADPSSAAFIAGYAALREGITAAIPGVCLNPTRIGFFGALERMGARVILEPHGDAAAGETVGTIEATAGALKGIAINRAEVPSLVDELPLIACIAARSRGDTVVRGAEELRVKESDRIAAIVQNLRAIGAEAEELSDGFVVTGSAKPLSGRVATHADHRIAMAFGVLGALPGNSIEIDDPSCVSISYPGFWDDIARLARA